MKVTKAAKKSRKLNYSTKTKVDPEEDKISKLPCQLLTINVVIIILKVIIWCLLMALFVHLEFGAVFFIFTAFALIWTNFRKTPRAPGETSAYSVFNRNCEPIAGTITAQQLEAAHFGLLGGH